MMPEVLIINSSRIRKITEFDDDEERKDEDD